MTGCENLHENGVLRVTIMPQTRHSSKFSGHVSCPDFLDHVSVLFTASVAPCSCFSTTTKGMGERINQSSEPAPTESFFSRQGARTERSSCTEQRRHLLDNSQHSPLSSFPILIVLPVLWGPTKVSQLPKCQIISFVLFCMSFDICIQRISFFPL